MKKDTEISLGNAKSYSKFQLNQKRSDEFSKVHSGNELRDVADSSNVSKYHEQKNTGLEAKKDDRFGTELESSLWTEAPLNHEKQRAHSGEIAKAYRSENEFTGSKLKPNSSKFLFNPEKRRAHSGETKNENHCEIEFFNPKMHSPKFPQMNKEMKKRTFTGEADNRSVTTELSATKVEPCSTKFLQNKEKKIGYFSESEESRKKTADLGITKIEPFASHGQPKQEQKISISGENHHRSTNVVKGMESLQAPLNLEKNISNVETAKNHPICTDRLPLIKHVQRKVKTTKYRSEIVDHHLPPLETPNKSVNHNFVTPSEACAMRRPFPRLTQTRTTTKTRSEINNEFQSKKILFTTPNSISCPLVSSLPDHSMDLLLDDSVNFTKSCPAPSNVPATTKLSPIKEIKDAKRSNDDLFSGDIKSKGDNKTINEQNVMEINGKSFMILKKIGSGGSSMVYLAQKRESEFAVKVICDNR